MQLNMKSLNTVKTMSIDIAWSAKHVHEVNISGSSRTNNFCEGWSSSFARSVGRHHPPSVFNMTEAMQMGQAIVANLLLFVDRHHSNGPRKSTERTQKVLYTLCTESHT